MILGEDLARERLGRLGPLRRFRHHGLVLQHVALDAVQLARDELKPRVAIGRAARVRDRHPAVEVRVLVVAADGEHVVGAPRQVAGKVRRLDPVLVRAAVLQLPDERRTAVQVAGDLGEAILLGRVAGHDFVADLPDRRVVIGEQARRHDLLFRRARLAARAHERHVAADVLLQQPLGAQQVVLVVLLEHPQLRRLAQRPEMHRRRVDRRGDIGQLQVERAGRQRELTHVAHERDIRVVDGDEEVGLVLERCGDDGRIGAFDCLDAAVVARPREDADRGDARRHECARCAK